MQPIAQFDICGGCGQPDPQHLTICPTLEQPTSSAVPADTMAGVDDMEHKLGEAV